MALRKLRKYGFSDGPSIAKYDRLNSNAGAGLKALLERIMHDIAPIRDEASHQQALAEIRRLWGSASGTPDGDRLDVLLLITDAYESEHHAIEPPDPIEAIEIRMAELGIDRASLGEILGIASGRVSEILNRKRRLTIEMMRTLATKLNISERCLLRPYELAAPAATRRRTRAHA